MTVRLCLSRNGNVFAHDASGHFLVVATVFRLQLFSDFAVVVHHYIGCHSLAASNHIWFIVQPHLAINTINAMWRTLLTSSLTFLFDNEIELSNAIIWITILIIGNESDN